MYVSSGLGAVYIFLQSSPGVWTQNQILSGASTVSSFGCSMQATSSWFVIGGKGNNLTPTSTGSASVWVLSGSLYVHNAQLLPSAGIVGAKFGASVAVSGNNIIVGATQSGNVYIYDHTTVAGGSWTQAALLTNNIANSDFGVSVSLDPTQPFALVGAAGGKYYIPFICLFIDLLINAMIFFSFFS